MCSIFFRMGVAREGAFGRGKPQGPRTPRSRRLRWLIRYDPVDDEGLNCMATKLVDEYSDDYFGEEEPKKERKEEIKPNSSKNAK